MSSAVIPNIRKIINERGLKQCAIAERAGYSKQQFNASDKILLFTIQCWGKKYK